MPMRSSSGTTAVLLLVIAIVVLLVIVMSVGPMGHQDLTDAHALYESATHMSRFRGDGSGPSDLRDKNWPLRRKTYSICRTVLGSTRLRRCTERSGDIVSTRGIRLPIAVLGHQLSDHDRRSYGYVTRKFRIIPMSSCSRIWQW